MAREPRLFPICGPVVHIITSCSGSFTGSRRSISWSISVKMAVLAPIPNASDAIATVVNTGLERKPLSAKRTSDHSLPMYLSDAWRGRSLASHQANRGGCHRKRRKIEPDRAAFDGYGEPLGNYGIGVLEAVERIQVVVVQHARRRGGGVAPGDSAGYAQARVVLRICERHHQLRA